MSNNHRSTCLLSQDAWEQAAFTANELAESCGCLSLAAVIPDLYASEINASIEWFWDGGYDLAIGDEINGWRETTSVDDWWEALEWLQSAAIRAFPNSEFAVARAKSGTPA